MSLVFSLYVHLYKKISASVSFLIPSDEPANDKINKLRAKPYVSCISVHICEDCNIVLFIFSLFLLLLNSSAINIVH